MKIDSSLPGIRATKGGAIVEIKGVKITKGGTTDIYWDACTPFTWIENCVAAEGQTLTVTQTASTYTDNSIAGNDLDLGIGDSADVGYGKNPTATGYTNAVSTQKCKTMEIVVSDWNGVYNALTVAGTTIESAGTYTIDVSAVDSVMLEFTVGANAQTGGAYMKITSIKFY